MCFPVRLFLLASCLLFPISGRLEAGPAAVAKPSAKPPVLLSLKAYVETITAENPKILASRLDEAAADYEARSTYASYFPHLTAVARVGYVKGKRLTGFTGLDQPRLGANDQTTAPDERSFTQEGPGLNIPIFRDGTFLGINVPPAVAQKRAARRIAHLRSALDAQDIASQATETYLLSIKASHVLELRRKHLEVAQQEANRVGSRASSNLATAAEVGAARLLLEGSQASFTAERGEAVYSFFAVADLLGLDPSRVRIQENYPTPERLPDFETIASLSSGTHPKVRLQKATIDQAKAGLALERSRQYPTVNAQSFDFQYGDFHGHAANQWVSFLAVNVPVFDFGEAALATKSARKKAQAETLRLTAVRQDVRKELVDAFVQVAQSNSAFSKSVSDVAEQQRITTRLAEQAKQDQAVLGDLNSAKIKLLDSQEAEEQAHYDLLIQYSRVQRVSAGAWQWLGR